MHHHVKIWKMHFLKKMAEPELKLTSLPEGRWSIASLSWITKKFNRLSDLLLQFELCMRIHLSSERGTYNFKINRRIHDIWHLHRIWSSADNDYKLTRLNILKLYVPRSEDAQVSKS